MSTGSSGPGFGPPVRSHIPEEFLDLMGLHPQLIRQPTVEYLPIRRLGREAKADGPR
jgi:hypothetical protein